MDFWSRLRYTNKGPHSLGSNNSNNIGIKYRGLHPSMLGEIDVLVCGNSDPGTSGLLSPFAKIDGLYFNKDAEPSEFYFNLMKDLEKKWDEKGYKYIKMNFENPIDFYNALYAARKFTSDRIKAYGTSVEDQYEIVINEDSDMDDSSKPSTIALQKKRKKKKEDED